MNDNSYKVVEVDINEILPNRFQPRIQFDEEEILELSDSIKEHGVIQPIIVRTIGDKYEIIAGERRYKASVLAGKEKVPVIIKNLNDKDSAEIALIENIQRKNLTPIEEALSYKKILDMGYLTQESLAMKLGKSQSSIANKVRLLNLSDEVQEALLDNKISERHARSLLRVKSINDQNNMLEMILKERLTVRKTDEEIDKLLKGETTFNVKLETKEEEKGEINMNNEVNQIPNIITPQGSTFDIFGDSQAVPSAPVMEPVTPVMPAMEIPSAPVTEPVTPVMPAMEIPSTPVMEPVTPVAPAMEIPSAPVMEPVTPVMPAMEIPSAPVTEPVTPVMPAMEIPSAPVMEPVTPVMPAMEIPSAPVMEPVTPVMPAMEIPSTPVMEPVTPVMPAMEIPSTPVMEPVTPVMPAMEIPSAPVMEPVTPVMPAMEIPSTPVMEPVTPVTPEMEVPQTSPIIDSSVDASLFSNSLQQEPITESINVSPTTANETVVPEPIIITDYNKQYDPIMPNFNPEPISKIDFKEIISAIRECSAKIEKFGYKIDVEEYDLSTLYQVIFKIEK